MRQTDRQKGRRKNKAVFKFRAKPNFQSLIHNKVEYESVLDALVMYKFYLITFNLSSIFIA